GGSSSESGGAEESTAAELEGAVLVLGPADFECSEAFDDYVYTAFAQRACSVDDEECDPAVAAADRVELEVGCEAIAAGGVELVVDIPGLWMGSALAQRPGDLEFLICWHHDQFP